MSGNGPSLLIVEPALDGHHGVYAQWLIRGAIRHGFRTCWATARTAAVHPRHQTIRDEFGTDLDIVPFHWPDDPATRSATPAWLLAQELRRHGALRKLHGACRRTIRPDFILLPYLDSLTNALGLLGSPFGNTPFAALAMRPSFHFKAMGIASDTVRFSGARRFLFSRVLDNASLKRLFTIDPCLKEHLDATGHRSAAKVALVLDPAESAVCGARPEARNRLGIPPEALVILVYGDITARKGLDCLLNAANAPGFPRNAHLLLAGRQEEAMARLLESPAFAWLSEAGRVHRIASYVSADEECDVFAASDIVWLGYRGHAHGSGVMVQAGRRGLPVLACREGHIGRAVEEDHLGVAVCVADPGQVVGGLLKLARDLDGAAAPYRERAMRRFAQHTPERFADAVCLSILTCLQGDTAAARTARGESRP